MIALDLCERHSQMLLDGFGHEEIADPDERAKAVIKEYGFDPYRVAIMSFYFGLNYTLVTKGIMNMPKEVMNGETCPVCGFEVQDLLANVITEVRNKKDEIATKFIHQHEHVHDFDFGEDEMNYRPPPIAKDNFAYQ